MINLNFRNPEFKTYSILTYGCTFNQADSLKIESLLEQENFRRSSIFNASLLIINTCAVKHSTHTKIMFKIKDLARQYPHKKIIVTGCLPFIDIDVNQEISQIVNHQGAILHPHEISNFIQIVNSLYDHQNFTTLESKNLVSRDKSNLPLKMTTKSHPKFSLPIQISEGCNNNCSYCCTTIARGNLVSFDEDQILNQIQTAIKFGIKEILLTSQDLGNYNSKGMKLHDLLRKISELEGNVNFRLGMLNPDYLVENIDQFLQIFEDKRFYRFLHIPIQSANNRVLKIMRRKYQVKHLDKIIDKIYHFDPYFSLATDIITGFPTETDEEHLESLNYIKNWKPDVLNISKFSSRPNTDAKNMQQHRSQIIKKRSKDFSRLFKTYKSQSLSKWIGWKGEILINEEKKNREYPFSGRNLYYLPIILEKGKLGEKIEVEIIDTMNQSLIAKRFID